MTVAIAPDAAERWLFGTLNGDATLRTAIGASGSTQFVFEGVQPQDSDLTRAVVFQFMSGDPVQVVGADTIFANLLYLVKVVEQGEDYQAFKAATSRIYALLHKQSGSNADGEVWGCLLEDYFRSPDPLVERGISYRQAGGIYRIYAT